MEEEKNLVLKAFGKCVNSLRDRKGIKVAELAKMVGFHDITKGTEKINLLQQYGLATPSLVDTLIEVLDLDPVQSHILIEGDKEKTARQLKDYWPKHLIHRDGTTFYTITEGQLGDFEVEKLQDEIDRIREEMEPSGLYSHSFPRGYAAARLAGFQSYLNQIERGDFPPATSGTYRRKIALIRQGKNPKGVEETLEVQPVALLETIIEEISKNTSGFLEDLITGIKSRKQGDVIALLQQRSELDGAAVAVALYLGAKYRCEKVVSHILARVGNIDDRNLSAAFHAATEYGYPEIVAQLLATGADPNAPVEFGRTPLMIACWWDRPITAKVVEALLADPRIDVNQEDEWGRTALHWAAFRHQPKEVLSMLVEAGADLTKTDVDQDTPLHKGLCNCDVSKYLLDAGSDVNARDRFGTTPLLRVLSWGTEGQTSILRLLLDRGADLDVRTDRGENPWTIAAKWNRVSYLVNNRDELLDILNEYAQKRGLETSIEIQDSEVQATGGAVEPRVHDTPETGLPAWIAGLSKEQLSKELIRTIKGKDENKALRLLEAGADPNMRDWRGETLYSALHLAVKYGCSQVVSELLALGADAEHTERHAALYMAAKHGYPRIVRELLQSGASVNWVDTDGKTPLMAACFSKSPFTREVIALLMEDPAININQADHRGRTALHYAAFWWQPVEVASLLLQAGAELNRKDDEGNMPLHEALRDYDLAKFLIDSGADVNARDKFGFTPLMKVIHMGIKGKLAILKLLVESGSDLDAAYTIARKRVNSEKVIAILDKYSGKGKS